MKLTRASCYAILAVTEMAKDTSGKPVASHLVAERCKIPERFLLKILKPLVDANILRSLKGPNGGYRLERPPNKISVLEIGMAIDGQMTKFCWPLDNPSPKSNIVKALSERWETSFDFFRKQLGKLMIADLT